MKDGFQGVQQYYSRLNDLLDGVADTFHSTRSEQYAIARVHDKDSEEDGLWVLSYPMRDEEAHA
jgi:hypothetical protein